ncbi:MAG: glyoxalase/bleomycin resistance/dioxygenase family protein [Actinomycetales bacterium]|nr:MAG: glyoxalase/bleomycin resistance/dioxygenase family protein [Actinomycetales bacterium]
MSITQSKTTVDCADVAKVAAFWSAALERPIAAEANEYFAMIPAVVPGEQTWLFLKVPEGKTAKNRMHVDFGSTDRAADVARLLELGASLVGDYDEWGTRWTTLQDVEGNEFCIGEPSSSHTE